MLKKSAIALLALAVSCAAVLAAETQYKHPVAVIPYAANKPVIDGKVDDAEWQGAFSQRALQTTGRTISARQARFWMMWDEENLYIAMRDPLRPGERPIQQHRSRQTGTDLDVIFDDCYEIWVSVDATDPAELFYAVHRQLRRGALRCDPPTRGGQFAHQQLRHQLGTEEPPHREE